MVIEWDEGMAQRIVRAVVDRQIAMFGGVRDLGRDDLISEGMMAAFRKWPKYNPEKSKPQTYLYRVVSARFIDIWRNRQRQARNDTIQSDKTRIRARLHRGSVRHESTDELASWVTSVYAAMKGFMQAGNIALRPPRARSGYPDRAQRSTLLLLQKRMGASSRGLAMILKEKPELCRAIHLDHPPTDRTIRRLKESGTHIPAAAMK